MKLPFPVRWQWWRFYVADDCFAVPWTLSFYWRPIHVAIIGTPRWWGWHPKGTRHQNGVTRQFVMLVIDIHDE